MKKTLARIPGQTKPLNGWRTVAPPPKITCADEPPSGYRNAHEPEWYTPKAVMFRYYDWHLWIPLKAIVAYPDGTYGIAAWAVESAKATDGLHTYPDTERLAGATCN